LEVVRRSGALPSSLFLGGKKEKLSHTYRGREES
jgi:hypothetical protein